MRRWFTNNGFEEATANPGEQRNIGTRSYQFTVIIETTDTRPETGGRLYADLIREMQLRFGPHCRVERDA